MEPGFGLSGEEDLDLKRLGRKFRESGGDKRTEVSQGQEMPLSFEIEGDGAISFPEIGVSKKLRS